MVNRVILHCVFWVVVLGVFYLVFLWEIRTYWASTVWVYAIYELWKLWGCFLVLARNSLRKNFSFGC